MLGIAPANTGSSRPPSTLGFLMPRRNLLILIAVTVVGLLCHQQAMKTSYSRMLANAMASIENRALDPVGKQALFEGAMEGMLGRLDDCSEYIPPDELQKFHEDIDLQFGGVGMEVAIDPETKQLKVLAPLVGSPAQAAGILAGDAILQIGGVGTQGMAIQEAVALLRGRPGEPIALVVLRAGEKKPREIKLVREVIQVDSVLGDTRHADGSWNFFLEGRDRIGYLRISNFTDETVAEFDDAMQSLAAKNLRGLVLDLRDNPGGYLLAGVDVCKLLIPPGLIVTTRGRGNVVRASYSAGKPGPFTAIPLAVIVNQYTASAAEIVAACLQDHHRAAIVGQRTYGKGTVQEIIDLEVGCGAMKLTTSNYWRPSGQNIQRPRDPASKDAWGVSPDPGCEVVLGDEEFTQWQLWRARRDVFGTADKLPANASSPRKGETPPSVDRQLLRAVEWVEKAAKR